MTIQLPSISLGSTDTLIFLVAGLVAGILASMAVHGRSSGILLDMVLGVIGAFLGRWIFGQFGISLGTGVIPEIVVAFVGAFVLLLLVHALSGGFRQRRST
ncbi:MAG TPA: GlsB/YeaQ/YmgE family stress response membrane protein [Candidatus Dormibacteraeota bacterium]